MVIGSRAVAGKVRLTPAAIKLLSGPSNSSAHTIAAFGLFDRKTLANQSLLSFQKDFPQGTSYTYPAPHAEDLLVGEPALDDFLTHL